MATLASVFPKPLLTGGVIHVEPGKDMKFTVDATVAFSQEGGLPVEGAEEAAVVTHVTNALFEPDNCMCVIDAHVKGCTHSIKTYTEEALVVPNQTLITPEQIATWREVGESRILRPHAQFGLDGALMAARLSRMVTGNWPTIWGEHGVMGTNETALIGPVSIDDYSMVHYKGTHPLFDSHSGIIDASGNQVGTLTTIASRREPTRAIFVDGNTIEVCVFLTLKHLAQMARHMGITVYCIIDGCGFLPIIGEEFRNALLAELSNMGVEFVYRHQLRFN